MQDLSRRASRRLYEVSRDLYAPVLAAFAAEWLEALARHSDSVAVCLGRDGLAPFLAARALLRASPCSFPSLDPRRVRLAYISRPIARGAAGDARKASLLDRYLRGRGGGSGPLLLVDVGIHGSIQDALQQLYPARKLLGRYLILRRRVDDPHGAAKRGFLAELDVPPSPPLSIGPPPSGWELGGTLRSGHPIFLRRQSVHVLEDLWNGVSEAVEELQVSAPDGRIVPIRRRVDRVLTLSPVPAMTPMERIELKRAALRGVVDGVARDHGGEYPRDVSVASRGLASWLEELADPALVDAHILRGLVRAGVRADSDENTDT